MDHVEPAGGDERADAAEAGGLRRFVEGATATMNRLETLPKPVIAAVNGVALAGGHAGIMNPFALLLQVREFFDRTVVLAGAISDGRSIRAAQVLGADLVHIGTRFIATAQANAPARYKQMLVDAEATDLVYTDAFSGVPAMMLKESIRQFGLDPDRLPPKKALDVSSELNVDVKAWREIWRAGQGVGSIHDLPSVDGLVRRLRAEYAESLTHDTGARH